LATTEEAVSGGQAVVHGVPLAATFSPVQLNCSPVEEPVTCSQGVTSSRCA
jgi:hypothetical protein